jgi:hypothetical protein
MRTIASAAQKRASEKKETPDPRSKVYAANTK